MKKLIIAVDYDDTIVDQDFPNSGTLKKKCHKIPQPVETTRTFRYPVYLQKRNSTYHSTQLSEK